MRVRPINPPPPIRVSSPPRWLSNKRSTSNVQQEAKRVLCDRDVETAAGTGQEDSDPEAGMGGNSSGINSPSSPPGWSPRRLTQGWAKLVDSRDTGGSFALPDLSSLPMSPSNALRAAKTMAHDRSLATFLPSPISPRDGSTRLGLGRGMSRLGASMSPRGAVARRHAFRRAYVGTLLSIIERPKFENRCLSVLSNYVWPLLELGIEFLQFSLFNGYTLPAGLPDRLDATLSWWLETVLTFKRAYVDFSHGPTPLFADGPSLQFVIFAVSVSLVGAIAVALLLLAWQFGRRYRRRLVTSASATNPASTTMSLPAASCSCHQPLASYINLLSGALYIPLLNILALQLLVTLQRHDAPVALILGEALLLGLCLSFLVPLALFVSQNQGNIRDEHAFNLRKRRHNRLQMLLLLVKTTATAARALAGPNVHRSRLVALVNLLLFGSLLLGHLLTNVYYHTYVNRAYAALYLGLTWGAATHLVAVTSNTTDGPGSTTADVWYWRLLLPVFAFGWALQLSSEQWARLHYWRFAINKALCARLAMLDLADNAEVIYRYDLSALLYSATRMGAYARFLATHDPDDPQVEKLFLKALKQEPRNAEILGAYADFLVNRAGREEEAAKLFQRAVEADGDNRDNLEAYAQFLSEKNSPEALYYHQRALLQYYQHYEYRDLYANSQEPMMILDGQATVLDCNGAALSFFRARRRSQLCNHPRLLLQELVAPSHVEPFRHKVHGLVNSRGGHRGGNSCSFEATVLTFGRVEVPVQVLCSRMQHNGRAVVHVCLKDMTPLRHAHAQLAKLELRLRQTDLLHKLSSHSHAEHRELARHLFDRLESCPHLLALLPSLSIQRFSPCLESMLGRSRASLLHAPLSSLLPAALLEGYLASLPPDFHGHLHELGPSPHSPPIPQSHSQAASPRDDPSSALLRRELPSLSADVPVITSDGRILDMHVHLWALAVGSTGPRYILAALTPPLAPSPPPALHRVQIPSSPSALPSSLPALEPSPLSSALFAHHPSPLLLLDTTGLLLDLNPAAQALLGYSQPGGPDSGPLTLSSLLLTRDPVSGDYSDPTALCSTLLHPPSSSSSSTDRPLAFFKCHPRLSTTSSPVMLAASIQAIHPPGQTHTHPSVLLLLHPPPVAVPPSPSSPCLSPVRFTATPKANQPARRHSTTSGMPVPSLSLMGPSLTGPPRPTKNHARLPPLSTTQPPLLPTPLPQPHMPSHAAQMPVSSETENTEAPTNTEAVGGDREGPSSAAGVGGEESRRRKSSVAASVDWGKYGKEQYDTLLDDFHQEYNYPEDDEDDDEDEEAPTPRPPIGERRQEEERREGGQGGEGGEGTRGEGGQGGEGTGGEGGQGGEGTGQNITIAELMTPSPKASPEEQP